MFDLTPQDDFVHATGAEESWRESYSFDFYDPSTRLSGFGLMGASPNQQAGECVFTLWRDDILLVKSGKWDYHIPRQIGDERQHFGPLAIRVLAPFKTLEISYDDGYCRLELGYDSIQPPYSWLQSERDAARPGSHHYQQQGRYRGVARVGKDSIPVQGWGARDHGWGPDARANVRRWLSATAQFSENLAFQTLHATLLDGREVLFGYVFRGAQNDVVQRSQLSASYNLRHGAPSGCNLDITTVGGKRLTAAARVLNAFNTSFQHPNVPGFLFSCAAEFHMDGQTGFGRVNAFWRGSKERPEEWLIEPAGAAPATLEKLRGNFDETVY